MKSIILSVCCLLACVAGAFPLNPSFTPEAVAGYKAKADAGDAEAQYRYAMALAIGRGVAQDKSEAVKWFRKSAEQGDHRAQNCLGCCCAKGEGIAEDKVEAVKWFRKSAEQGNVIALCNLGWCFEHGQGVTKNMVEADQWYGKALKRNVCGAEGCWIFTNRGGLAYLFAACPMCFCLLFMVWVIYPPARAVDYLSCGKSAIGRRIRPMLPFLYPVLFAILIVMCVLLGVKTVCVVDLIDVACLGCSRQEIVNGFMATVVPSFLGLCIGECICVWRLFKRSSTRAVTTVVLPTFPQYVKAMLAHEGMLLVIGLPLVNVLVQVRYHVPETLFLLGMLVLIIVGMIWVFPTRKKYEKLLNGGKKE